MPRLHPRPWHRGSVFGDGPRIPRDREQRAVWKARVGLARRAGRLTAEGVALALALLRRLGADGRCDPSHACLAGDTGGSVSTVQRALKALRDCGLVSWARRLVRAGWRAEQTSNAYVLTLGQAPNFPVFCCDGQSDRETRKVDISYCPEFSAAERQAAMEAMTREAAGRPDLLAARRAMFGGA